MLIDDVAQAVEAVGLCLRGGFRPDPTDAVPPLAAGRPAATVLMVGNAGPAMWQRFAGQRFDGRSSLDDWTRDVLTAVAERFGARAVYPFDRPFLPFQTWSMRAEPCHISPIRMLIHPTFGLWHAWRGALLFAGEIAWPEPVRAPSPCDSCRDRPCLSACPVAAFATSGYDVPRCHAHLAAPAGEDCMELGCRARRACPVGSGWRYVPAQARFHMEAFRRVAGAA
jgi:hypothetical protein